MNEQMKVTSPWLQQSKSKWNIWVIIKEQMNITYFFEFGSELRIPNSLIMSPVWCSQKFFSALKTRLFSSSSPNCCSNEWRICFLVLCNWSQKFLVSMKSTFSFLNILFIFIDQIISKWFTDRNAGNNSIFRRISIKMVKFLNNFLYKKLISPPGINTLNINSFSKLKKFYFFFSGEHSPY